MNTSRALVFDVSNLSRRGAPRRYFCRNARHVIAPSALVSNASRPVYSVASSAYFWPLSLFAPAKENFTRKSFSTLSVFS